MQFRTTEELHGNKLLEKMKDKGGRENTGGGKDRERGGGD